MSEAPPPEPAAPARPRRWHEAALEAARRRRWSLLAFGLILVGLIALSLPAPPPPAPVATPAQTRDAGIAPAAPLPHKLQGQRVLSGRVLDDRNQPLVDARVLVSSLDDGDALPWEARSDKEGHFAFHDLVAHALSIEVSHPGHDATERTLRADDAGELVFTLARQGELLVSLRDAPGHPVEGALVTLTGPGLWPAAELRASRTGEVLFENLALGEYQARARRDDRAAPASQKVRVVPGQRAQLSLTLEQGLALGLVVVDRTAGTPVADAELSLYDPTPGITPRTLKSDAHGQASIVGLVPGELRLEVRHPGHAPRSLDLKLPESKSPLRVEIDGEAALSGIVVDERGEPVRGALLSVSTRDGLPIQLDRHPEQRADGPGELGVTRGPVPKIPIAVSSDPAVGTLASESDALGAFRITGLPPAPVILSVAHSGYAVGQLEVRDLVPHAERRELRVVLREAGRVEGSLRDARDHPVPGVYVSSRSAGGAEHSAITDAAGHFVLVDVVGELSVSAEPQGSTPLTCHVTVLAHETARCDLHIGSALYELSLRVVDEFGFGLEGALLSLSSKASARTFTQVTKRDGGALIRELPEPPYQLHAEAHGFVTTSLDVTKLERELKVKLQRAGSLAGVVTDSLGRPVPFALVSTDEGDATGSSDDSGAFLLSGVAPGALRLLAAHRSVGEGMSAELRARPGETLEGVRIVLSGRYLPSRDDAEASPRATASAVPPEKSEATARRTRPSEFEIEQRAGDLVFAAIQAGGAADKAGVRAGDVLVSIDGEPVLSAAQGRGMLRDPAGHSALIQLRRERAQLRVRYKRPELQ